MANVLLAGVLEVEAVRANHLPRMDYFGLCDPYLIIEIDSYSVTTEVRILFVCLSFIFPGRIV